MKNICRIICAALVLLMLLSSCARRSTLSSDDTVPEETTEKKLEDTTVAEETTEAETTEAAETTANDGKVHVESITLDKYEVNIKVGEDDMPMVTMLPEDAENKGEIWESSNTAVATVNKYGKVVGVSAGECTVTVTSEDNPSVSATVKVTVKAVEGVEAPTYINGILIANKTYALPATYNPGVDGAAQAALDEMINGAKADGVNLFLKSGFRSYSTQQTLYNNYVARDGVAEADR